MTSLRNFRGVFLICAIFVIAAHTQGTLSDALEARLESLETEIRTLKADSKEKGRIGDVVWVLRSSFAVLTMQYGFALLETGSVRPRTTVNILYKNLVSTLVCGVAFFLTGWGFAFGESWRGLIGTTQFAEVVNGTATDRASVYALWNFQFSFAAASTTIMSGAMAERTGILAYALLTLINCLFTYPVVVHWVWAPEGWLNVLGFRDFAGDGPVHLLGGLMGLCGTIFLGPRLGRFGYKTDVVEELVLLEEGAETERGSVAEKEAMMARRQLHRDLTEAEKDVLVERAIQDNPPITSPGYLIFGTIVLWVSWYAFNAGSSGGVYSGDSHIKAFTAAINTSVAAASGGTMGFILSLVLDKTWLDIRRPVNGLLAGLVGITAGCAYVQPWEAFIIGAVSVFATLGVERLVQKVKVDDPVTAVGVHCGGGIAGLLLLGLFDNERGLFWTGSGRLLGLQCVGILSIIAFGTSLSFLALFITDRITKVRVSLWAELYGVDAVNHNVYSVEDINPDILLNGGVGNGFKHNKEARRKIIERIKSNYADKKGVVFLPSTAANTVRKPPPPSGTISEVSAPSERSYGNRVVPMINGIEVV